MVNTGKPSSGCYLCRRRKIKCDEGQPGCQKCARIGKSCPGYRNATETVFRHVNVKEATTSSDGAFFDIRDSPSSFASPLTPTNYRQLIVRTPSPTRESCLSINRHELSVTSFLNSWLDHPGLGPNRPYYSGYVELFARSTPNSSFYKSFLATAAANLANFDGSPQQKLYARATYVSAIEAVQTSLADPIERLEDGTLAAVFLFSALETMVGGFTRPRTLTREWISHSEGILALIRARGFQQLETQVGRSLFGSAHVGLQIHSLRTAKPLPDDFEQLIQRMWEINGKSSFAARKVVDYVRNTTRFRADIKFATELEEAGSGLSAHQLTKLLERGEEIDRDAEGWHLTEHGWEEIPTTIPIGLDGRSGSTTSVYYYHALFAHLNWYRYHFTRVYLHNSLVKGLEILQRKIGWTTNLGARLDRHILVRHDEVTRFIRTIPYSLGDVDESGHLSRRVIPEGLPLINVAGGHRMILVLYVMRDHAFMSSQQSLDLNVLIRRISRELRLWWVPK